MDEPNGEDDGAGPSSSTPSLADAMASLQSIMGSQECILNKLKEHDVVLANMSKRLQNIEEWAYDRSDSPPPDAGQVEREDKDDDDDNDDDKATEGSIDVDDHSTE